MSTINVGLIGYGLSGRYLQAPFFQALPQFSLKKIVTSRPIDTNVFNEATAAADIDELLNDPDLHLVSIASPSSTHFEYAKKCLNAGKHVLVEKPITTTRKEAEELYALAEAKKRVLCVYQNRRFDSDYLTCRDVVKLGYLGNVHTYDAHFHRYKPQLNPKQWKEEMSQSNGMLYDLGAHLIDQAIYLFGIPTSYSGEVYTQREGSTIDDAFFVRLVYPDVRVNLKCSLLMYEPGPRYEIHGNHGTFMKSGMDVQEDHLVAGMPPNSPGFGVEPEKNSGHLATNLSNLEVKGIVKTKPGSWYLLYLNLADAITNGSPLVIKKEEILKQIEILENIKSQSTAA